MSEASPLPDASAARKGFAFPVVPASYFGMVLGLAGLASVWRAAHLAWGLPSIVGEAIGILATAVWVAVTLLFALKWTFAHAEALGEVLHPVQCCFVGLTGVATMLIAGFLAPYSRSVAVLLFLLGAAFNFGFAVWRTGGLWQGGRDPETSTPVLYLPTVAGSFVTGTIAALLGWGDWGQIAFGAGFFSWLAIESILVHRFLTSQTMPTILRPTLGIQMAPGPVGAVSLISVWPEAPSALAYARIGYGLLQTAVLTRLAGWIRQQPFGPSYWAFTFGVTALAIVPVRFVADGDHGAMAILAPALFLLANLLVGSIAIGTVWLAATGKLFGTFARVSGR